MTETINRLVGYAFGLITMYIIIRVTERSEKMYFIHFGIRMKIEELFYEWCETESVANKPNSMIAFLMGKGWLNEKKIIKDLVDTPQMGRSSE